MNQTPERPSLSPPRSLPGPLAAEQLSAVLELTAGAPEPLAAHAAWLAILADDGDATGVRKRCFEHGAAVMRYAVAVGLAALHAAGVAAPGPLANTLRGAARLSDGHWCGLARDLARALASLEPDVAALLQFALTPTPQRWVEARNRFVHDGGAGHDAASVLLELLEAAAPLLTARLCYVLPTRTDDRMGSPLRQGMWRRARDAALTGLPSGVYLLLEARVLRLDPLLPVRDGRVLLPEAPSGNKRPWRALDPDTGEHAEDAELGTAVAKLAGVDGAAPQPPTATPPLVARAAALELVSRAARETTNGEGARVLLLTGRSGVGRSRLLTEARLAAPALGFRLTLGAAASERRGSALWVLREALRGRDERELSALRESLAAVTELRASTPSALEAALERIEEALFELASHLPLLLVLDDLQWADETTLTLLTLLVERATLGTPAPLCLLLSARDGSWPTSLRRLLAAVEREVGPVATRLALAPLRDSEARELVARTGAFDASVNALVTSGAEGRPFYLVQPLLVWWETGQLEWRERAWSARSGVTLDLALPGLNDLVSARLDASFPTAEERRCADAALCMVLGHGAPLPLPFLERTLARLPGGASASAVVDRLLDSTLLELDGPRNVVFLELRLLEEAMRPVYERRAVYREALTALFEVLEQDPRRDAELLADGWERLGELTRALPFRIESAHTAQRQGRLERALAHAERWIGAAPTPTSRYAAELFTARTELLLGDAAAAAGRASRVLQSAQAVQSRSPELLRLRALALAAAFALGRDHQDAQLLADAIGSGDAAVELEVRLTLAERIRGREGLALLDALALDSETLDSETLDNAPQAELAQRAAALRLALLYELGAPVEEWESAAAHARRATAALNSKAAELELENDLAVMEAQSGRPEAALARFELLLQATQAWKLGSLHRLALINRARCLGLAGRQEASAAAAQEAATAARAAGNPRHLAAARSVEAQALLSAGRLDEAATAIDDALQTKLNHGDPRLAVTWLRKAAIADARGLAEEARQAYTEARDAAIREGNERERERAEQGLSYS